MTYFRLLIGTVLIGILASCGGSKFKSYNGPEVTYIVVKKESRRMYLFHNDTVLEAYDIHLGFAPEGDKKIEGDGKTPEGTYLIDRRNAESNFHLSLGISYPNAQDLAEAAALGKPAGGDIFIHGRPKLWQNGEDDWTWGCIAVTDKEMETIFAMVKNGTPISIQP